LAERIAHFESASEYVFVNGGDKQQKECPGTYRDDASDACKKLVTYRFATQGGVQLVQSTFDDWMNSEQHLLYSMILMGEGELYKSKLSHIVGQHMCDAYGKSKYTVSTALDPLGVLSHDGVLGESAFLGLNDPDGKFGRGGRLKENDLKKLLITTETGTIQDTRYRPATLPSGLPRMLTLNADAKGVQWWSDFGFPWVTSVLNHLIKGDLVTATHEVTKLDGSQRAVLRRVAFAFPTEPLLKPAFVKRMQSDTEATWGAGKARLDALYAARDAQL
jgi:hypothetical protein